MNILLAVVDDLFWFAAGALFGIRKKKRKTSEKILYLSGEQPDVLHQEKRVTPTLDASHLYEGIPLQKNTVMYTAGTGVLLRSEPTVLRDTVLGAIPYGTMIMVLETKNGWAKIQSGVRAGWVESRDLADRAAHVLPQFTIGEANEADDPNTIRLRTMIDDEFSAGRAGLPLQSHEYVLYRLQRKGVTISWPDIRPRTPGTWKEIFSNDHHASVRAEPTEQGVMEIIFKDGRGHMCFVEAIFPDGSVQVSEANWPENGIYNERVLLEDEWRALQPSFITFS